MQIAPASFNSPSWVDGEKILGTAYLAKGSSAYDGVAARPGLIVKSIPAQSFFRKVYLYMDLVLLNSAGSTPNGYYAFGVVIFKMAGQVVAKLPARIGQDMDVASNVVHTLTDSVPTRFPNQAAGGRDSIQLSIAYPTVNTDVQQVVLTPAFLGVQADEVSFDLEAILGWQYPALYTPTGFRVYLAVESSPFPY